MIDDEEMQDELDADQNDEDALVSANRSAHNGNPSYEEAGRELAFFFPNFRPPETELKPVKRMLALIQHNRARESREEILAR